MKKVMVFGTFDIVHPGHESFFRQARALGDFLIVVVARDRFVEKAKGRAPKNREIKRLQGVRKNNLVSKAILGSKTHNYFRTLRTNKPEVLALGYDQKPTLPKLKKELKRHRIKDITLVRLQSFKPGVYKTAKLLKNA